MDLTKHVSFPYSTFSFSLLSLNQFFLHLYTRFKIIIFIPIFISFVLTMLLPIDKVYKSDVPNHDVIVSIPNLGNIRGSVEISSRTKREYLSFTSIPYGEIPGRFQLAKLRERSLSSGNESIFDATEPQKACMQPVLMPFLPGNFTEDCLTLNIYTPTKNVWKNGPLPVIVFIHGGSFFRWSGNMFSGHRFLEEDNVVFISINYRLNIFGFFCLETESAAGNFGLSDQILALQWIKQYISHFGGDNQRVTIAGQSAGAAAVLYLLDSPLAKGLFHRAISASGDSFAGWAVEHNPLRNSLAASTAIGCANGTDAKQDLNVVLSCMKNMPANRILDAMSVFYSAPVVQSFPLFNVPKTIPRRLTSGPRFNSQNIPIMIGMNRNDGSFLLSRIFTNFLKAKDKHKDRHYLKNHFVRDLLISSHFGFVDSPNGTIDYIAKAFLGDSLHSGEFGHMAHGLSDIYSTFYFGYPAYETAVSHSDIHDVYFYSFDYAGNHTLYPYTGGVEEVPKGISHGEDAMYLFDFGNVLSQEEQRISSQLIRFWINFASTGNPNLRHLDEPSPFQLWPKFCKKFKSILNIDRVTKVESFCNEIRSFNKC